MQSESQFTKCLLCFMPQQRHLTNRDYKIDLSLKAITRFTDSPHCYCFDTLKMPICSMNSDTPLLHFVCLCTFVRTALITMDEIWYFHPRDGMTWPLGSKSQVFWVSCFWGHQIWYTCSRQLHRLFQAKMERRQHTAAVFRSGNIWQPSFNAPLFLLQPRTQAYKYTMKTVAIPHRRKHQCTHSLCQLVSEVKLFHLSGVLLSSYKASVRTAGRLIVTY